MIKPLQRHLIWAFPLALICGAILPYLQPGSWLTGWLGFSFLFLLTFLLLGLSIEWARGGKTLALIVGLAFILRFIGGVATYLALPVNGFQDEDDRAGYVYTDAHHRDAQAWDLASSTRSLLSGFSEKYASDQYGGLLTLSAFIYRYISPDAQRPLMLVLISALMAALGLPFLWKALVQQWDEKLALAACWIYALYPESILLGGSAMREPYLMAFSAFALWGFVNVIARSGSDEAISRRGSIFWIALGIIGMLLVSPAVALVTLIIFGGWLYFTRAEKSLPWWGIASAILVFVLGLFLLSATLNRSGEFNAASPLHVINDWLKFAVKWDVYQLERGSGWVQKLFDEMPGWLRLPFVMAYGVLQPVLPAAIAEPTTLTWKMIAVLRALGWYTLLPILILSFTAAWHLPKSEARLWWWLSFVVWGWILFTSLRGGGDQWDNPRYRAILFLWEALLAGRVWVWWRETRNAWFGRVLLMEAVFLLFFGQWYISRYYHFLGGQLPFAGMVAIISVLWGIIFFGGLWLDRKTSS